MELGTELSIVLEEYDIFDGDDCVATGSYVIVNGEKLNNVCDPETGDDHKV